MFAAIKDDKYADIYLHNICKLGAKFAEDRRSMAGQIKRVVLKGSSRRRADDNNGDDFILSSLADMRAKLRPAAVKGLLGDRAAGRIDDIVRIIAECADERANIDNKLDGKMNNKTANPRAICDVGCADGSILTALGHVYPDAKLCGTDIYKPNVPSSVDFQLNDGKSLGFYKTGEFDIVLCLVAMHHFKNKDIMLKEMGRIVAPGGLLIYREHDAEMISSVNGKQSALRAFLDIVHFYNDAIFFPWGEQAAKSSEIVSAWRAGHWAAYASKRDWADDLSRVGLESVYYFKYGNSLLLNPQQLYWAAARKKGN
jgi:SAM-dependent methyltransferase